MNNLRFIFFKRVIYGVLGFILLLQLVSCDKRPDGVLSEKQMESLLTDMMLADALEQSSAGRELPDSVRKSIGESVMKAHGVDYATLDSTYGWYARNLDDYYKLYSKVEKKLQSQKLKVSGKTQSSAQELQNDIWQVPKHLLFSRLGLGDSFVFEIPGDAMEKGERLEWKMHINNGHQSRLLLGLDYEDGTTSVIEREYRGDRNLLLRLVSDTARNVSRIYGVMTVSRNEMPVYVDSISLLKQPFDSVEYRNAWSQRDFYGRRNKIVPDTIVNDTVSTDSVSFKK